jgi:hypothetical protein
MRHYINICFTTGNGPSGDLVSAMEQGWGAVCPALAALQSTFMKMGGFVSDSKNIFAI